MIEHFAVKPRPAEPRISQLEVNLVAQASFQPDAEAVDDDADHELRIDRRSAHLAVERQQVLADYRQIHEPVDRAEQVIPSTCRCRLNS